MTIKLDFGYHSSIRGRLMLYLLLPIVVMFLIAFFLWRHLLLNTATEREMSSLEAAVALVGWELESRNLTALAIARTLAQAQENGLFGQRAETSALAFKVLEANPQFIGVYVAYEPDTDLLDSSYLVQSAGDAWHQGLDEQGRFLPYWHRPLESRADLQLTPLADTDTNEYYQRPKRLVQSGQFNEVTITEPYWYEGVQLVEFTFPIVIDGEFQGIAGVDFDLEGITAFVSNVSKNTEFFLVSAEGRLIAATKYDDFRTLPMEETPLRDTWHRISMAPEGPTVFSLRGSGRWIFSTHVIDTGNWTLVMGVEADRALAAVTEELRSLFLISLLLLLLVVAVAVGFARSLSERLKKAVEALKKMTEGDLDPELASLAIVNDEVRVIGDQIHKLVGAHVQIERQCHRIAEGDYSARISERGPSDYLVKTINRMADLRQKAEVTLLAQNEQLERAQNELVEAEKIAGLGSLVAGVAHEINTPLGVAVTVSSHLEHNLKELHQRFETETLQRRHLEEALSDAQESTDLLSSSLNRASHLVRSFKNIATDQASGEKREIVVSEYIGEVVKSFRHEFKHTDINISVDGPTDEPVVNTDPGAIAQILSNLLMNSRIHGFENGTRKGQIRCSVKYQKSSIHLTYEDNGKGLAGDAQRRIFEPFYTTNRGAGGSGLGMYVVYNLVNHRLGGRIACHSDAGQGVTFEMSWDVLVENDQD